MKVNKFYEHHKRSLVKALTFRLIILTIDFLAVFAITKKYEVAWAVVLFASVTHTIVYFFHERMWNGIHWGKEK